MFSSIKRIRGQQAQSLALPREEAVKKAAWDCLLAAAPKKNGDNDLTYIPVDGETKALDQRELALRYDLLPAIAAQALERMAGEPR